MADTPRTQLERAFRLIQQERLDEASALLQPLVKKEPDNADAWWLLANAVTEPDDARNALENVMRLTPNNIEARDLLDQLNAAVSPMDDFGDINFDDPFAGLDAKPSSGEPTDLNSLFDDDVPSFVREGSSPAGQAITGKTIRDFTTDDDEALLAALDAPTTEAATTGSTSQKSPKLQAARAGDRAIGSKPSPLAALASNRRLILPLGLVALVVLLLLVVVVVILPALNPPPPPATVVANVATGVPSVAPVVATAAATAAIAPTTNVVATSMATTIPTTAAPAATNIPAAATSAVGTASVSIADVSAQAVTALQAAGINNAQVNVVLTALGQTLTARFCGPYGPKLDGNVRTAMDVVAAQGARVSDQIQGVGVEVDSCSDQTQVYAKEIAAIKDVLAYVNKTLPAAQFRSSWKTS
jgi:hypothetical protein